MSLVAYTMSLHAYGILGYSDAQHASEIILECSGIYIEI